MTQHSEADRAAAENHVQESRNRCCPKYIDRAFLAGIASERERICRLFAEGAKQVKAKAESAKREGRPDLIVAMTIIGESFDRFAAAIRGDREGGQ